MPPAGYETAIPARKRPQTHALDRAATGFVVLLYKVIILSDKYFLPLRGRLVCILTYHSHLTAHTCRGGTARSNK